MSDKDANHLLSELQEMRAENDRLRAEVASMKSGPSVQPCMKCGQADFGDLSGLCWRCFKGEND